MIGAIIMPHSDDNGLILPPIIIPIKIVVIPIFNDKNKEKILKESKDLVAKIEAVMGSVHLDDRDYISTDFKFNDWKKIHIDIHLTMISKLN